MAIDFKSAPEAVNAAVSIAPDDLILPAIVLSLCLAGVLLARQRVRSQKAKRQSRAAERTVTRDATRRPETSNPANKLLNRMFEARFADLSEAERAALVRQTMSERHMSHDQAIRYLTQSRAMRDRSDWSTRA